MYHRSWSKFVFQHAKILLFQQGCNLKKTTAVLQHRIAYFPCHIAGITTVPRRLFSNNGDLIVETETFEDNIWEDSISDISLKSILYLESDPNLEILNRCSSAQDVLDLLDSSGSCYTVQQQVQAIILLWDFCRKSANNLDLQNMVLSHSAFKCLIDDLVKSITILDPNESTCCYLYLKKLGVEPCHNLMQNLQLQILDEIRNVKHLPLSALSRFSVAISTDKDFNSTLIYCNMVPHIVSSLKSCTSAEDIRLVTICLSNLRQLVTSDILDVYKAKISELINSSQLSSADTKCILKVLNFLNNPVWSHKNSTISRQLLLLILPVVEDLLQNEVKAVFKVFQSHLEPAAIVPSLLKVSENLLKKHPTPEILSCVVQYVEPKKREHFINIFKNLLTDKKMWQLPNASINFFTILRSLKISDSLLCDEYWTRILNRLQVYSEENEYYIFSKHCHRYMYFNNNLGGTYRHIEFEKYLTHLCIKDISTGISGMIPSKFANIAPFIIGYGHTYKGSVKLPNIIVSKIESMASQFNVVDNLQLSRGIQIALEMRFRHFIPKTLTAQLNVINDALDSCTQRLLDQLNKSDANDLNAIVRSLNNRKACKKSALYTKALNKYNEINIDGLNSRLLRNMSFNLSASHFVAPGIIEKMFEYLVKNDEYITGDTAEKILSCSYNLGYSPQMQEGLYYSANIIMRDFDYMTGLSIIQACLALCFYKAIPEQLINKVFCVDFIKRVEEEIEMCYSKATYPERVLNQVMQLNRAVCLDFPEADVPWFQQNYLEAQLSKHPFVKNRYNEEVRNSLLSVLKDESLFRCNHITPYGYRIDFVIHFDKNKHPISAPAETTVLDKITKVAILLLKLDSLCQNDLNTLKGKEALKMRHLEMLGYKVVHVNEKDWNDMNAQGDKINYLMCLLQINS